MRLPRPPSRRTLIVLTWLVAILVALLVVWLAGRVISLSADLGETEHRADTSAADRADLRADLESQQAALDAANAKLLALGETPVRQPVAPPVSLLQGPMGPVGPVGPRGPKGDDGDDGDDGASITGETGATGAMGPMGPAGPKGDAGPQGPAGPAGKDGAPGTATPGTYGCPDGQSMTGLTIAADGSVTVACAPAFPGGPQ